MTATATPSTTNWQNLFGVCACLGEDFGFNPIYLRIAFGAALIWSPFAVIGAYFGLGAIVLASRLIVPNRRRANAPRPVLASVVPAGDEPIALPLAA